MTKRMVHILKEDLVVPAGTVLKLLWPADGTQAVFVVPVYREEGGSEKARVIECLLIPGEPQVFHG